MINQESSLDYLIPFLRFHLGDYSDPYRYTDAILRTALVFSVRMLQRRWNDKYVIDAAYNVFRSDAMEGFNEYADRPEYTEVVGDIVAHDGWPDTIESGYTYTISGYESEGTVNVAGVGPAYQGAITNAPKPVVQYRDEPPIILQASILVKSGSLQEASWQVASWRDDEISVSNIQGDKSRQFGLQQDRDMLETYFKRRLFSASRQSLPGFRYPPNWREG
jgi:hypothetical protein